MAKYEYFNLMGSVNQVGDVEFLPYQKKSYPVTQPKLDEAVKARTLNRFVNGKLDNNPPTDPSVQVTNKDIGSALTLASTDDGTVFNCTVALSVTIPAGLSPRPSCIFVPPPTGNVSFIVGAAPTLNGTPSTTITRSRANNPAGVVLNPYTESDGYGLSGS